MRTVIKEKLAAIEQEHEVTILYACESGSRAWGFPSKNSDFDVRFIYVHPKNWYLSIIEKRDVIELPVDGLLDINGWDLRKSLRLMRKSNSPLNEWLSSPIRYRCPDTVVEPLMALAGSAFLPESSAHHYLSMAKSGLAKARKKSTTSIKNYLYTIRVLLCCQWIVTRLCQPPMHIAELMDAMISDPTAPLFRYVAQLIQMKTENDEKAAIERYQWFENYIWNQIVALGKRIPKNPDKLPVIEFDRVFRKMLEKEEG
jgi:predicted nucleotidyltransferase